MDDPIDPEQPRQTKESFAKGLRDKTPDEKDRIDTLLDKKKNFNAEIKSKAKPDHTFISSLQGQLTKSNNKMADLNHKYNQLEQKYKIVNFPSINSLVR
jgi:hypothetical protein